MYKYKFPRPSVTVDCVLFGYDPEQATLDVLLIRRNGDPFKGQLALPGGFVEVGGEDDTMDSSHSDQGESLETAARRELEEETGAKLDYLEQLATFGEPNRDPRGRVISVAYYGLVRSKDLSVTAGSDASEAQWHSISKARAMKLAFDHNLILETAVKRVQSKTRYAPIGFNLMPTKFTIRELRQLYEALLFRELDRSNFSKKMLSVGILSPEGEREWGTKKVQLYRFNKKAYDSASSAGFNFEPRYMKGK